MKASKFIHYLREFADYIEHMEEIEESKGHLKIDEFLDKYGDELSTRIYHAIKGHITKRKGYSMPTVYQFLHFSDSIRNFGESSREELREFITSRNIE